jgi:hypothetical protein
MPGKERSSSDRATGKLPLSDVPPVEWPAITKPSALSLTAIARREPESVTCNRAVAVAGL